MIGRSVAPFKIVKKLGIGGNLSFCSAAHSEIFLRRAFRLWSNLKLPCWCRISIVTPPGLLTGNMPAAWLAVFILNVFLSTLLCTPLSTMEHTEENSASNSKSPLRVGRELIAIDVSLEALPILDRLGIIHQEEPRLGYRRAAATLDQLMQLKREGIPLSVAGNVAILQKPGDGLTGPASPLTPFHCSGSNPNDYSIPINTDWVYAPINTYCEDATGGTITSIDIYYQVIHPWADNAVWLNIGSSSPSWDYQNLETWNVCAAPPAPNWYKYQYNLSRFNGRPVNQRWDVVLSDGCPSGPRGYLDSWSIWVYYAKPYNLSGYLYNGPFGSTGARLPGVLVSLTCAGNSIDLGTVLGWTLTGFSGEYTLVADSFCPYYNIVEWDLAGYISVGASSPDGSIKDRGWIQYASPLYGKTLSSNNFWDVVAQRVFLPIVVR